MGFEKVTDINDEDFGDTGKGKLSDALSDEHDVSVRSLGGGNAGHWAVHGTRKAATHVLPMGALHPHMEIFLARGMVTHIPTIYKDAADVHEAFESNPLSRTKVAKENHILFEAHKLADATLERRRGGNPIGTTGSGIGPAYADKALRVGMRFESLEESVASIKDRYAQLLKHWHAMYGITMGSEAEDREVQTLLSAKETFEGRIVGTFDYWMDHFKKRSRILVEGAQGSNLSIDSEGYPFVTSSPTNVAGHMQGAGIPMRELTDLVMVVKAYKTRVGKGPLPTKITGPLARQIQDKGIERGSTTGRERDVAWLDAHELKQRVWEDRLKNKKTKLAVLKGDVLDGVPEIFLATGRDSEKNPTYERFDGWDKTNGVREYEGLDANFQRYLSRIIQITRARLGYIGTGRDRADLIRL
jgi:adenylosuccinate synthase